MKKAKLKKGSLENFKNKFSAQEKKNLIGELTGGLLGSCHCSSEDVTYDLDRTVEN